MLSVERVACLAGGALGVDARIMVDADERFSRSAFIGAFGALLLRLGIGYMFAEPQAPGDPPALVVGLSSAMLTYCASPLPLSRHSGSAGAQAWWSPQSRAYYTEFGTHWRRKGVEARLNRGQRSPLIASTSLSGGRTRRQPLEGR